MKFHLTSIAMAVALVMTAQTRSVQARESWSGGGRNKDHVITAPNSGIKVDSALHQDIIQAAGGTAPPKVAKAHAVHTSSIGHGTYPFLTRPHTTLSGSGVSSVAETAAAGPREPLATMVHPPRTADEPYFKYYVMMDDHKPNHNQLHETQKQQFAKRAAEEEEDDEDDEDEDDEEEDDGEAVTTVAIDDEEDDGDYEYEGEFEDKTERVYTRQHQPFDYDGEFEDEVVVSSSTARNKKHPEEGEEMGRSRPDSLLNRVIHPGGSAEEEEEVVIKKWSSESGHGEKKKKVKAKKEHHHHDYKADIAVASESATEAIHSATEAAKRALGHHEQTTQEKNAHRAEKALHNAQAASSSLKDEAIHAA
ncbi:hypothetical protein BGW39_005244 [Mortierella sp. 14UC]|nr:hypothetical protein BGW39_005244 [Mortierella sp. 14UC]